MNGLFHDQQNHLGVPGIVVDESRGYNGAINGSGHRYLGQQQQMPTQHTPYNYAPSNNPVAFGNALSQNNSAQNGFDMKMLANIQQQRHQEQQQQNNHLQMMMNTNQLEANSRGGGLPLQHQQQGDIQLSQPQDAGNLNYQQQSNFQSSNLANFLAQLQRQQDGQQGGGSMNAPQHRHQGMLNGQQMQSQMPTMNMNQTFANAHQNHAQMGSQNLLNNNHTLMQTMLQPVQSVPQPMHRIDAGMMSHQRQQIQIAGMQQRRNSASGQHQPGGFSNSDQLRRQSGFAKGNGVGQHRRAADALPSQSKQLEERLKKFQTLQQLAAPSEKSFQSPKMAEVPGLVSISNNSKLPITTNNVKLSCAEEKPTVPLASQQSHHVVRSNHDPGSEAAVQINDLVQQSTRQNDQAAKCDNGVRGSKAGTIKEIQIDLPSRRKINFHIIKIIERMRPEAIKHE